MQPKNGEQGLPPSNYRALLTKKERNWLLGSLGPNSSKSYEYKLKSSIKKKIQIFVDLELPLLIKNNYIIPYEPESLGTGLGDRSNYDNLSLGKAKVPGPNPGQGSLIFENGERIKLQGLPQMLPKNSQRLTKYGLLPSIFFKGIIKSLYE